MRPQLGEVGGDLPVGEHHALGDAGGAGGVRQGRHVFHRVDVHLRFRGRRGEHVDERAVPGGGVADEYLLDAAREFGRPSGRLEERGDGDDPAGGGVVELLGELLGGGERVHGGDRGARARGPVEGEREGHRVGAVQGQYVALADPGLGERGGDPPVEPVHLVVREGGAVRAVDERRQFTELGGTAQHGVVDGEFYGRDVCELAAEHGSSSRAGHDGCRIAVSTTWAGPGSGGRRS